MTTEAEIAAPPSRRKVIVLTLAALVAALLIVFTAVLPAEYNRDPTGLGSWTGIGRLWAPEERTVDTAVQGVSASRSFAMPFRSDIIEFPLATGDDKNGGNELEYKVHLEKGATYMYSWSVAGVSDPEEFYTEFHGHTVSDGKSMTVADYRKAAGHSDNGTLTAPFTGIHGWYFQNQSVPAVKVTLRLAGFYSLIPAGQPGNEKGLAARQVER